MNYDESISFLCCIVFVQDGQECGGSYLKLLSTGLQDLAQVRNITLALIIHLLTEWYLFRFQFHDKTPYTIMFGPDKCGNDIKLHFIFRHINPLNGSIEEKHCRKPKLVLHHLAPKSIRNRRLMHVFLS